MASLKPLRRVAALSFSLALAGAVICPYCGEQNVIALDPGSGDRQEYVEDCQVCCQPWRVRVRYRADGGASISVEPDAA